MQGRWMGGTWHAVGAQSMVPVTHYSGHAYREPLFQGQGSQELEFTDPQVVLRALICPSLEPHLGFFLIFEDHILGPWRRKGKDGVIWKLGVGLHNP